MDPLSALSVVAATLQFVDFSAKLLSQSYEIYKGKGGEFLDKSKALQEEKGSITVAEHLLTLNQEIRKSRDAGNEDLQKLCDECNAVAHQILGGLNKLKGDGKKPTVWSSFRLALHTVWSRDEVKRLEQRLETYRQNISFHMIFVMRYFSVSVLLETSLC